MTPEERACALLDALGSIKMNEGIEEEIAIIASAIREAESGALDLACAAAAGAVLRLMKDSSDRGLVASNACDAIRSLKHTKE